MAVGWSCPRCDLVLSPHVAEHRCDPPSAGVTVVQPLMPPLREPGMGPGPVSISPTNVTIGTFPDTWTVTTCTGSYLAAVPDTGAMRAITETAA